MRAFLHHPAMVMTRTPLLILLNRRQRERAGRVRPPSVIDGAGSN
jgi:hypothetical protein